MSDTRWTTARRQLMRLALLTVGLAPVVTVVLMGLSWLQRNAPEWVYWQAELIFVVTLELAYKVTALLSLLGTVVLGFLFFLRRGRGLSQPVLARGLMLCVALLCALALSEVVCAGWISRSHRFTAVPDGGLGSAIAMTRRCGSRSRRGTLIFAPISLTRPATARSTWS